MAGNQATRWTRVGGPQAIDDGRGHSRREEKAAAGERVEQLEERQNEERTNS